MSKTFILTANTTVIEAFGHVTNQKMKGIPVTCPVCGHTSNKNILPINKTNATCLMVLYGISQKEGNRFYHVKELEEKSHLMAISMNGGGDFSRMRHWGFIEEMPKVKKVRTSGYWRITDRGKEFCENKLSVSKAITVVSGTVACLTGDSITIVNLFDSPDSYYDLMKEVTKSTTKKTTVGE